MKQGRQKKTKKHHGVGSVLVIGGGIAGVQSALDLAESGFRVYLVESSPSIGGVMAQLDKTFPTNDCSMCILAPKLVDVARHPNITLLAYSDVKKIEGDAGNFMVGVLKKARFVSDDCTACGECAKKCLQTAPNEFDMGLSTRRAIYIPFPQAVPARYVIDRNICINKGKTVKCARCTRACKRKCIDFTQEDELLELNVGAIILATGAEPYDPAGLKEFGYGIYQNVVTSIEFERFLSASGPTGGKILRPSDKKEPKRIAFVQCVGSRMQGGDPNRGNPHCSSVCCMYALKESLIAREHNPSLEIKIFSMDLRAYGKEFEQYRNRVENEKGIAIVRNSRVASLRETGNHNLVISYNSGSEIRDEEFDLVILSVGMEIPKKTIETAGMLGISMDDLNFCNTGDFTPIDTSRPGIFICGAVGGPKDIPDSVAQASGASAKASSILAGVRDTLTAVKEYPDEIPQKDNSPRIGVFVCHCGTNIGGVIDVASVAEYAQKLPGVVHAEHNLYSCSQDTQKQIRERIAEHHLNRVIVAACTPRTHEPLFRDTLREAGLNPYLFEMVNIRDQCSWVHSGEPASATEKAKDLVRMAVIKSIGHKPLERVPVDINRTALVIGGGLAGMVSALELSRQGIETHLVEKDTELGGNLRRIGKTLSGEDVGAFLKKTVEALKSADKVHLHIGAESQIESISGFVGNYTTRLRNGTEIKHGVIIVATGANPRDTDEFMHHKDDRIMTLAEFEERYCVGRQNMSVFSGATVAFILCADSRTDKNPNCSRICCLSSLKNAIALRKIYPDTNIYVFYRDIMAYGTREKYYTEAARLGITFIRYDDRKKPHVIISNSKALNIKAYDVFTESQIELYPDYVVLATGIEPPEDNKKLASILKVPLTSENYYLEAHMKLRPVDFATEGIFVAGLAHSPKLINETISQACAAVGRAMTVLSKDALDSEALVSEVNENTCRACGRCVELCSFNAVALVSENGREYARINPAMCKGCGTCAAECPTGAIISRGFSHTQMIDMISAFGCLDENTRESIRANRHAKTQREAEQ